MLILCISEDRSIFYLANLLPLDFQFAFTEGVRDYITKYNAYLQQQIGNPEGEDLPNKKYYDPRKPIASRISSFVDPDPP